MTEPHWILVESVLAIHQRQIAEHGGLNGVRDRSALESAIYSAKNLYHYSDPKPSLSALAAAYAYSISRNHPFNDGNKRVALVVTELFLEINNYTLIAEDEEKYHYYWELAAKKISREKFNEWISTHIISNF